MSRNRWLRCKQQQAQPFGQMAVQWLTCESERTGLNIRHQVNGREKRIGNLPVDGWCAQTRTAYQFHGCFWHGCPKCHADPEETNPKNGKTMAVLLADTKKHTAYLRRHVKVIEMWECQWKRERDPPPRRKEDASDSTTAAKIARYAERKHLAYNLTKEGASSGAKLNINARAFISAITVAGPSGPLRQPSQSLWSRLISRSGCSGPLRLRSMRSHHSRRSLWSLWSPSSAITVAGPSDPLRQYLFQASR